MRPAKKLDVHQSFDGVSEYRRAMAAIYPRDARFRKGPKLVLVSCLCTVLAAALTIARNDSAGQAAEAKATNGVPVLPKVARPEPPPSFVAGTNDLHLDKTPPRRTRGLDLVKMGWTYNCMECHKLLPAKWHYDRPMVEHESVKLEHGNNRYCLNCHHPTNRNAFVDYDGAEIAQSDVVQLCAKCHGTIFRDWKAGVHGRRNGFWKVDAGPQTQLRCIECHDPHAPKFKSMKPLAAPRYPARAPHASTSAGENTHAP